MNSNLIMQMSLITGALLLNIFSVHSDKLEDLFSNCRISDKDFDECLKFTLNQLNPLFKYGLPEYNVAPFDPHKQPYVQQVRGDRNGIAGYKLILRDVSEYGWTKSWITKLK
jgi:Haemolymph juvenile hormone binding protein (JHBP)